MSWQSISRRALAATAAVALLAAAAPAAAAEPERFTFDVNNHFYLPGHSALCGFDVFVREEGTAYATLFMNADETAIIREIDWYSGLTRTFSAPSQGTSFTEHVAGPLITWYPEGTDLGAPAIAMVVGTGGNIGDDHAEAGYTLFDAVVVFVDPATGIPGIDFINLVDRHGNFIGDNALRRCEALTAA